MSPRSRLTPALLLALGGLAALAPAALAQPGTAPQAAAPSAENAEAADRFPVFAIISVEVMHTQSKPEIDVVAVRGLTSAEGWSNGELVPLSRGVPPDGVLDLVFVADAPQESAAPGGYTPIHAVLPLSQDHPFKAIRVRGATNSVLLRDLQGYTEVKPPVAPCEKCVGRTFVAKGSAAPAGLTAAQIVREDDLPPHARVIRASDGIADVRRNPDRLTILLGEDGRIVDAAWE